MKGPRKTIKTINLNSDIFQQENPIKSTLPINLLRSFVERKRNSSQSRFIAERYPIKHCKNNSINGEETELKLPPEQPSEYYHREKNTATRTFHLKTHVKANNNVNIRRRNNSIDLQQPGIQTQSNNIQEGQATSTGKRMFQKAEESLAWRQQQGQRDNRMFCRQSNQGSKVNPYTHQQYTYIKNREQDYMAQLKRTTRIKRMSSIIKSYQVAPIALAHPTHKRRPSFIVTPKSKASYFRTHSKHKVEETPSSSKRKQELDTASPSPWEWGYQNELSRQFTF